MTGLCRRTLLKSAAATCGTGLLAACASESGTVTAPAVPAPSGAAPSAAAPGGLRVTLGQVSDIPVGGAISVSAPGGDKVLLAQAKAGEVTAFSAVCPHEGCSAQPAGDHFACPCHGSEFELDGSLRQGPAREGLTEYRVQVVDGQVLPA
jgi:Rieske Fe-S protein